LALPLETLAGYNVDGIASYPQAMRVLWVLKIERANR